MEPIASSHWPFHLGALISVFALALRGQFRLRVVLLLSFVLYSADDWFDYDDHAWPSLIWNILFFCINLYVLVEIILDRSTFGLSEEEKKVLGGLISLSPGQFRKLIRLGQWRHADEARLITTEGIVPTSLFYIHQGTVEIMKGGRTILADPPTFIGEVAFLRGSPASATVAIEPGARYIEWPSAALRRHLNRHGDLKIAFNRTISDDLAMKVARS